MAAKMYVRREADLSDVPPGRHPDKGMFQELWRAPRNLLGAHRMTPKRLLSATLVLLLLYGLPILGELLAALVSN